MNSLCQFIFVQNISRLYAGFGIIHPLPPLSWQTGDTEITEPAEAVLCAPATSPERHHVEPMPDSHQIGTSIL